MKYYYEISKYGDAYHVLRYNLYYFKAKIT